MKKQKNMMSISSLVFAELQFGNRNTDKEQKVRKRLLDIENYSSMIDEAEGFSEIWKIVRDTVKSCLGKQRLGMLLFLDDLPLHLGAYHQLGTNNIVLNRSLVNIVKDFTKSRKLTNSFVYSILTHEYLHALGHVSETEVRSLVHDISKRCFGEDHIVTVLAAKTPWSLLKGIPLHGVRVSTQPMELIKNLEKPNQSYII